MAGFSGSFSTSYSESSSASNQSANNQDFKGLFSDKNLGKTDYVGPALVVTAFYGIYLFLKSKKLV